jgi:hypothetical protein
MIGRVALAALASCLCLPAGAQCLNSGKPVAKLEQVIGQVSLMKDGRVDTPLDLLKHSQVCAQQTVVTGPSSFARFRLEDNSSFEVYENSTVIFREDWPAWSHLLNVIMGRIKVFIDHSKGPNNNSVTTPTAVISVRGTIFDVIVEDADTTVVSCDEGLVQVQNITAPGTEPLLHPGDTIRIVRGQGLMGKRIDKDQIYRRGLAAARDLYQVLVQRQGGVPIGGGVPGAGGAGGAGGAQGDQGKGGKAPPVPGGNGH